MSHFDQNFLTLDSVGDERRPSAVSYAHGYGNRVASARVFAPLGHRREPRTRTDVADNRVYRGKAIACTGGACG